MKVLVKSPQDTITIEVWDKDFEEDRNKLNLSLKQLLKNEQNDFLGQVKLLVQDVIYQLDKEQKVPAHWLVLEKRSQRSHISGRIKIEIQLLVRMKER